MIDEADERRRKVAVSAASLEVASGKLHTSLRRLTQRLLGVVLQSSSTSSDSTLSSTPLGIDAQLSVSGPAAWFLRFFCFFFSISPKTWQECLVTKSPACLSRHDSPRSHLEKRPGPRPCACRVCSVTAPALDEKVGDSRAAPVTWLTIVTLQAPAGALLTVDRPCRCCLQPSAP